MNTSRSVICKVVGKYRLPYSLHVRRGGAREGLNKVPEKFLILGVTVVEVAVKF